MSFKFDKSKLVIKEMTLFTIIFFALLITAVKETY